MAWLEGWQYRKKITISGSSGAGTNYRVFLKVGESAGATEAHFHVEGHSAIFPSGKNQSGDLRFTASDGTTLLDFWVERVIGTSPNRVAWCWVEVSADLGTNQNIFCYYSNPSATNVSNGNNTFLFFDDFEGTTLDTTKWNVWITNGTYEVNNSVLHLNGYPAQLAIGSFTRVNPGSKLRFSAYRTEVSLGGNYNSMGFDDRTFSGSPTGSGVDNAVFYRDPNYNYFVTSREGNSTSVINYVYLRNNFQILEIRWLSDSVQFLVNENLSGTHTTNIPLDSCMVNFWVYGWYSDIWVDWVFLTKFVSPEPAFNSAGGEESPSSGNRRRLIIIST